MNLDLYAAVLVFLMALVTWLLRFMPFLIFGKSTPPYIVYLGKVLPSAIIGMLVIYCLKNVDITAPPFGLPECVAVVGVAVLQSWKRNALVSILLGTMIYMAMIRLL